MFLKTLSYRNYACGEGRAIQWINLETSKMFCLNLPIKLYNNEHSSRQCEERGGIVLTNSGKKVCKFSGSCRSGWSVAFSAFGFNSCAGTIEDRCKDQGKSCAIWPQMVSGSTAPSCTYVKEYLTYKDCWNCCKNDSYQCSGDLISSYCY
jgi:hypothetical protein